MEYKSFVEIPYYTDCEPVVSGLGYSLVELRIFRTNGTVQVKIAIAHKDPSITAGIGTEDCAKVHRLLLPRHEALLQSQDIYMEVTSPGLERNIKNAAEFVFFTGRYVKLYDVSVSDWVSGKITAADGASLTIKTEDTERNIPYGQISKAKLLNT